jgi:hypothetical protein
MSDPKRRRLEAWTGRADAPEPVRLGLVQVLYSGPNRDGSRKACRNCVLWLPTGEECAIHDAGVTVTDDSVCGYHVFGDPAGDTLRRSNLQPVDERLSGLEQVPGGSSCDGCRHFVPGPGGRQGVCSATWDDGAETHAVVHALGCCAAWEIKP